MDFESCKFAFELASLLDVFFFDCRERAERVAAGQKMAEEDIQESSVQSAQDFEDKSNKELKQFHEFQSANPIIPITDRHSSNRFLEQNVILVCQQKVNQDLVWRLPEQKLQENENLRQVQFCF